MRIFGIGPCAVQSVTRLVRSGRVTPVGTVEPVAEMDRYRCVVMKKDQDTDQGLTCSRWKPGTLSRTPVIAARSKQWK